MIVFLNTEIKKTKTLIENYIFSISKVITVVLFIFQPVPSWAESEPLTLEVCARKTAIVSTQKCIDELLDEYQKKLANSVMNARKKLSAYDEIKTFDESYSNWMLRQEKVCLKVSQLELAGNQRLIAKARCQIKYISQRIEQLH